MNWAGMVDSLDLTDWIIDTMNNHPMRKATATYFTDGEEVVAAVSGGADSMALLDCLLHCGKDLRITVAHLNHSLRGEESDQDAAFVEQYCHEHGVSFVVRRRDIRSLARQKKMSLELCGREERYAFFDEFGMRIATAHTLSDRAETLLFSLTRGAGLSGLCSIPRERGKIVRPLLSFSRQEIEEYCSEYGIPYRQDSSNQVADVSRNQIRLHVLPVLRRINPAVEQNIGRTLSLLEQDEDCLWKLADEIYDSARVETGLLAEPLQAVHPAICNRVLLLFLKKEGISPTAQQVAGLTKLLMGKGCRTSLPKKKIACMRKGVLQIEEEKENRTPSQIKFLRCSADEYEHFINNNENAFFFFLDYDKIIGNVSFCRKAPGDSIQLVNRPKKTLKKLCNEKALPLTVRKQLRILKDQSGVIWAEHFGIAQRVAPTKETKQFLIIRQERKE